MENIVSTHKKVCKTIFSKIVFIFLVRYKNKLAGPFNFLFNLVIIVKNYNNKKVVVNAREEEIYLEAFIVLHFSMVMGVCLEVYSSIQENHVNSALLIEWEHKYAR